jgi:hypothetical protein
MTRHGESQRVKLIWKSQTDLKEKTEYFFFLCFQKNTQNFVEVKGMMQVQMYIKIMSSAPNK